MKKKIEDYLHFYLGCKVRMRAWHIGIIATLRGINFTYGKIECVLEAPEWKEYMTYKAFDIWDIEPILRPLSDLTKEIEHNRKSFVPSKVLNTDFSGITTETTKFLQFNVAMELISWHFDLFGLIEAGLAVNAAELNSVSSR